MRQTEITNNYENYSFVYKRDVTSTNYDDFLEWSLKA